MAESSDESSQFLADARAILNGVFPKGEGLVPGSVSTKALDPGLSWLELRFVHRLLERLAPPNDRHLVHEILSLGGFSTPGEWQNRMTSTLRPLRRFYQGSRFQDLFEPPFHSANLAKAFEEEETRITTRALPVIRQAFETQIARASPNGRPPDSPFLTRLAHLAETFRLAPIETEILSLAMLYFSQKSFSEIMDAVPHGSRRGRFCLLERFVRFSSFPYPRVLHAVRQDGTLRRLGFLEADFEPDSDIFEFLCGIRSEPLSDRYFTTWKGAVLPLDRLMIAPADVETIRTVLANRQPGEGVNFLLGGPPGTGKTETVRSLARELGLVLYEVRARSSDNDENGSEGLIRMRGVWACQNLVGQGESAAILIDEADDLLGGRGGRLPFGLMIGGGGTVGKALLNETLDRTACVQFWVANHLENIDPSTRRRFAFAIRYDRATAGDRQSIWTTACERYDLTGVVTPEAQRRLAGIYAIDAGGIDSALRNIAHLPRLGWDRDRILSQLERLLEAQGRFAPGDKEPPPIDLRPEILVEPGALTIEPAADLNAVLEIIGDRAPPLGPDRGRGQRKGAAGGPSFSLLLYGPPGTGKTHLARYLAFRLGRPLHHRTAATILDKFVGGTEENIRRAFREAQREGAVLFFDEIDGLLQTRERASRSWEVTQVNELLSALEGFQGLFVAATNHESILDTAALRRFHFQLRFGPLGPAGVLTFYRTFLLPMAAGPFGRRARAALGALPGLVPGDFAALRDRLVLQGKGRVPHEQLIAGLTARRDARRGRPTRGIGFLAPEPTTGAAQPG